MSKRVCAHPDCPTLIDAGTRDGRCNTHRRERDRARGTRQQRGYDRTHELIRADLQRRMNAGEVFTCWRCNEPITGAFDLGHDDRDRSIYRGPEHVGCNRATSGR